MTGLVRLDLNNQEFLRALVSLEAAQQVAVLTSCRKILQMTWDQVYRDKGLHWEAIKSGPENTKERLYSLRITRKFRAVTIRAGDSMRFLSLHPDHDSAYN